MAGVRRLIRAILGRARDDESKPEQPAAVPIAAPVQPPDGFTAVEGVDLPAPGEAIEAILGDIVLAIANVDGTFHAITGVCPHAGGPLGDGEVDGLVLWCPFHNWNFHLETGIASVGGKKLVEIYATHAEGGRLFVRLGHDGGDDRLVDLE